MSEGLEMALTGTLTLEDEHRSDVMKRIRAGEYSLDEFQLGMAALEGRFQDAETKSTLPDEVDWKKLNDLLWETIAIYYGDSQWFQV